MRRSVLFALGLAVVGCGTSGEGPRAKTFGGDRPADLHVPDPLTEGKQYPLLVILHGYGANGFTQYAYFGAGALVSADKAFVIAPDGTTSTTGQQFWNADPACCDFGHQNPDDVGYISGLIEDITAEWPVDKNQVFVLGHSNGGYMAYRMACERADLIAAIGSLAGNAATDASMCNPAKPVSVLHMHGTADDTVPYQEGSFGAVPSVEQWETHDGCSTDRSPTVTLDLDTSVDGAETAGETSAGCPTGVAVDLWTMNGSSHIPVFNATAAPAIFDWLTAHKR